MVPGGSGSKEDESLGLADPRERLAISPFLRAILTVWKALALYLPQRPGNVELDATSGEQALTIGTHSTHLSFVAAIASAASR